jgi:hypothetical protein
LERLRRPKGGRFFMIWGRDDIDLARPRPKVRPTRRIDGRNAICDEARDWRR